jgi:predicted KAP-like P-loop ATPase
MKCQHNLAFLEKIVQVPFELPLPDRFALSSLLTERLNLLTSNTPDELFDQTRWLNIYRDGIQHFIHTPRDIVRLINTLNVTYPAIINEVNCVDFIAIEVLRVFEPDVYSIIRNNSEEFIKSFNRYSYFLDKEIETKRAFHQHWLSKIPEERSKIIEGGA